MLELLKVVLGSIIILGGIGYVGNDCALPDLSYEEEVVEEVVEEVDYDKEYLKALYDELDGLNEIDDGIEIEEYLKANNIQYTAKDVNADLDRYIRIERGEWVIEVLFNKDSGSACWLTFSSTLYE